MRIDDLKGRLPDELREAAKRNGIDELTPPQELAVGKGLLGGKSMVIASPTASGKTFVAEMAMITSVIWHEKKAVYVAPMRALVNEKYSDFKRDYPFLKIAMSVGDLDSLDLWLDKYDIIFASTEKLDSLIRHGLPWLDSIGCVVLDEIHMIDDYGRGPTLEILTARLRRECRNAQIIALSATIGNAKEIGDWLGSEVVESGYRPVPLRKGVTLKNSIVYEDGEERMHCDGNELPEIKVAKDTFHRSKQLIIFYSTKRNTEAGAERMREITAALLSESEKKELEKVSETVLHALGKPTAQCEKLARLVKDGIAFHHGGLVNRQRNAVEEAFKSNYIKALCSTTTLAMGVNLPAHTVLVRDTSRYEAGEGSVKMGVNEVTQIFGRAGRPRYDTEGRALIMAKNEGELEDLMKRYITAKLQPVVSKLGVLPTLRTHILAFVASGFLSRLDSIVGFLGETFYGYEYGSTTELKSISRSVLEELEEWKFVEGTEHEVYRATKLGKRVSELYIDPLSAKWMVDALPEARNELGLLYTITNTLEMRPYSRLTEEAEAGFAEYWSRIGAEAGYPESLSYDDPERAFSTALMLRDWANEATESEIVEKYAETPGSLFTKLNNADWLLYSCGELARIIKAGSSSKILELRIRVKYGIKKELLDLVRLEQVGRVRARMMYERGIRKVADLREERARQIVDNLFGKEIGKAILDQAVQD